MRRILHRALLAAAAVLVAGCETRCVTQGGIAVLDYCVPCVGPSPPSYCYTSIASALAGRGPGDVVAVDIGTYAESGLVLDGARLVGAGRHRTVLTVPAGPAAPVLTVYRGQVEDMTVRTGTAAGSTGIKLYFDQNRNQNFDYNATVQGTRVTTTAVGVTAISLTTVPAAWTSPGKVALNQVDVDATSENTTTVGVRVDAKITELVVRRPLLDTKGAVGIDIVRTGGWGTRFFFPTVRVAGAGIGLRRACDQPVGIHGGDLWYVNLLPNPAGRLIKEVAGAGACSAMLLSGIGGAELTSRNEFLNAPNGVGEYRGTTQPFACPGNGNALGSHWTDTAIASASVKICTSLGWRAATLGP